MAKGSGLQACNKTRYLPTDTALKTDDPLMSIDDMKEWIGSTDNMFELMSIGGTCWSVLHQGDDPDAKYKVFPSFMPESEWFVIAVQNTADEEAPKTMKVHDKIACFEAKSLVYDLLLGDGLDDKNLIETLACDEGVTIPKVILTGLCILLDEEGLAHLSLLPGGGRVVSIAQQLRQL